MTTAVQHGVSAPVTLETPLSIRKDGFDRFAELCNNTTTGAWDICKVIDHAGRFLMCMPFVDPSTRERIRMIKDPFNDTGSFLVFPYLLGNINDFRKSFHSLQSARLLNHNEIDRSARIQEALRSSLRESLNILNTSSTALTFLHQVKWIEIGKHLPALDWLYHTTTIFTDGPSCLEQISKREKYQYRFALAQTQSERDYYAGKQKLTIIKMVKYISNIALSVIGIFSLCFGFAIAGIYWLSFLLLSTSAIYVATDIMAFIGDKIFEDKKRELRFLMRRV